MKPPIAVLGAGPSGLALARLLEVKNIDYIVFERDQSPDAVGQGGSLDIHGETGQQVLKECGLFDEFKSLARYDGQAFKTVDREGNVLWNKQSEGRDDAPEIDRKVLRNLLLSSLPAEKIRWAACVESVDPESDGLMAVRFTDGSVERGFKLVVGADGAWSRARQATTSATPCYSGICYLQNTISTSNPIYSKVCSQVGTGTYMALSTGKSVIVQRFGDGSYNIYVGLKVPEHWSKTEASTLHSPDFRKHLVENDFTGWSSDITDLIKYSDASFHVWPLYALPTESLSWMSVPGVTLIGDAAHLAMPNGEGVNCAMYDSLQLSQEIAQSGVGRLDEAVKKYEEKMFPRGIEHINDGNEMGKLFYGSDSPKGFMKWLASMGFGEGTR